MEGHEKVDKTPWSTQNIEDFLYYCCPECDVKDKFQDSFIQHALANHPDSRENFSGSVKTEMSEDEKCEDSLFLEALSEDPYEEEVKVEESNDFQEDRNHVHVFPS